MIVACIRDGFDRRSFSSVNASQTFSRVIAVAVTIVAVVTVVAAPVSMTAPSDQTIPRRSNCEMPLAVAPTMPNFDPGGRKISRLVAPFVIWCWYFEQCNIIRGVDLPLPKPFQFVSQSVVVPRQMKQLTIRLNSFDGDCNMPGCIISVTPDASKHLCIDQF